MRTLVALIAFSALAFSSCLQQQCEDAVREIDSKIHFVGIVKDCYFDESERGVPTITLSNERRVQMHAYTLCCYVTAGDSVWKLRGSLKYFVKRGDSISIFYPECGNIQVRDSGKTYFNPNYTMECGKRRTTKKAPIEIEY